MRSMTMFILMLLIASTALMPQLNQYASGQTVTKIVVAPPPLPLSSLKFKQTAIEVKVVNATYADIMMIARIANPFNQTLTYVVEVNAPQPYISYPFGAGKTRPQPRMELTVVSEKLGQLDVTVDRWDVARATGSIEANSEDVIHVEGWMGLAQTLRMIWRESIEGSIGFSIRPETEYAGPVSPEKTEVKVKFTYPAEYTKADEANYKVELADGFKVIEYTEEFYGGFGLPLDMYKPRIPINSLVVFSALWVLLIASIVWTRRKAD